MFCVASLWYFVLPVVSGGGTSSHTDVYVNFYFNLHFQFTYGVV